MEFEFRRDVTGELAASFSMGHEAIAAWLLEEVGSRKAVLPDLYSAISQLQNCERWEYLRDGQEYNLRLTRSEAEICNAQIDFEADDIDADQCEGLGFYDDEARSSCGLDDFLNMLQEWERFVRSR
nr:YacL family protein [Parendozoicomonas sp. Alg238-R29]